ALICRCTLRMTSSGFRHPEARPPIASDPAAVAPMVGRPVCRLQLDCATLAVLHACKKRHYQRPLFPVPPSNWAHHEMSIEYRKLGNSGAIVTKFCLGTMTFGAESDEATAHRLLDDYAAAGGNFIDTADVYSTGVSETMVGKWLKGHPTEAKQMVVA